MYTGTQRSDGEIVVYFVRLVVLAVAFGIAFGAVLTAFLALVYRHAPTRADPTFLTLVPRSL